MRTIRVRKQVPVRTRLIAVPVALAVAMGVACNSNPGERASSAATTPSSEFNASPATPPLPQGSEHVALNPADFKSTIDHPYWPMKPGNKWTYAEEAESGAVQKVVVTVTDKTRNIGGIKATVVHDEVTQGGQLIEDTLDWYAQDKQGNLWYMGEDTKEYENGKVVSTAGSWEYGVDGAEAGIILPARPEVGMEYRQEYYKGEAEDNGKILSVDEWVEGPTGFYKPVLMTKDTTPLEPKVLEHKFYGKGVGPILTLGISGGGGREELTKFHKG